MKAKDLLPLLGANLNPEHEVHRIEETQDGITVNIIVDKDSMIVVGKVKIIIIEAIEQIKEEQDDHVEFN